jgi:bacillolysin
MNEKFTYLRLDQKKIRRAATLVAIVFMAYAGYSQNQKTNDNSQSFYYKPAASENPVYAKDANRVVKELLNLSTHEDLKLIKSEIDNYGFKHERYQLQYKGINVENGLILIHYERDGKLQMANGGRPISQEVDVSPKVSEGEAIEKAKQKIEGKQYRHKKGELVVYEGKLAYKVGISAMAPLSSDVIFVDAQTGEVIKKISQLMHATADTRYSGTQSIVTATNGGGQYVLHDNTRGQGIFTYNLNNGTDPATAVDFTDANNIWTSAEFNNAQKDIGALDAHWALEMSYDYWLNKHTRNSYDGMGSPIHAYIHNDVNYGNAFWDPGVNSLFFGDRANGPWTELDVVAHELGHGLTISFGISNYFEETGALQEGLSDIYAACVTNYVNGLGVLPAQKDVWNWAEETPAGNPRSFNLPLTYYGMYWNLDAGQSGGNGGFHGHAQVLRYWFYLLAHGGSGTNDHGYNYNVTGQLITEAQKIVYQSLFFAPQTFPDLKMATLQAAQNIYGLNTAQYQATLEAWKAVGVFNPLQTNYCAAGNFGASAVATSQIKIIKTLYNGSPSSVNGYGYDPLASTDLIPGLVYPFSFTATPIVATKYWYAWIDLDRSGTFTASELVYQGTESLNTHSGNLLIPSNSSMGPSRMRVGVSLTPLNSPCMVVSSGDFRDFNINVLSSAQTMTSDGYCAPVGSNDADEIIGEIKFGSLDGNANWYAVNGFSYNTYWLPKVWKGETYNLVIKPKFIGALQNTFKEEYFTIWIDYNLNKAFEPSEIIFQGHTSMFAGAPVTIPANAGTGITHLRIVMSRDAYSTNPCLPVEFGQAEDFKININAAQPLSGNYCSPRGICFQGGTSPYDYRVGTVSVGQWSQFGNYGEGYSDYYVSYNFNLLQVNAGQIYPLILHPYENQGTKYWKVWIDYNQNSIFEDEEIVFQNQIPSLADISASIAIDPSALAGTTRMRVALSYFADSLDPCEILNFGSVVDYSVIVQPVQLTCAAPAPLTASSVTTTSMLIEWSGSPISEFQYRKAGEHYWQTVATNAQQQANLHSLASGTVYEVRVRSICDGTVSSWATLNIATLCTDSTPFNFTISSQMGTSVYIAWNDASGYGNYLLQYREAGTLTWYDAPPILNKNNINLTGLYPQKDYEIRVRRVCASGESPWSAIQPFNSGCNAVEQVNVTNVNSTNATVTWIDNFGVGNYEVRYIHNGITEVTPVNGKTSVMLTLIAETSYSVSVRKVCPDNVFWIGPTSFTTKCAEVTQLAVSGVTATGATLSWQDSYPPLSYAVVNQNTNGGSPGIYNTSAKSYTFAGLNKGTKYHAKVSRACVAQVYSEIDFTTVCPTPQNLHPNANSPSYYTSTFSWDAVPGISSYLLEWRVYTGFNFPFSNSKTISGTTGTINVDPGKTYDIRVQAICPNANSVPGNIYTFTALSYCSSKGLSSSVEWIDQVILGTLNNSAPSNGNNNGYGNFTGMVMPNLETGGSYNLQYSAGATQTRIRYWRAWIDFNRDGDFTDPNELIIFTSSSSTALLTTGFTIPSFATLGVTRMRIATSYVTLPTPCLSFSDGEVEDYQVNINSSISPNVRVSTNAAEVEPLNEEAEDLLYPNPVANTLHLTLNSTSISSGTQLSIINAVGINVWAGHYQEEINVSTLPPGVYVLVIENGMENKQLKFIKQ